MGELSGPVLRQRREHLGLDRRPVAAQAGITVAQLCAIEAGGKRDKVIERMPKVDEVLTNFEQNGIPEGTNARRGRRSADGSDAPAESGEEGDPAGRRNTARRPRPAAAAVVTVDEGPLEPDDGEPESGVPGRWKSWRGLKYGDPVTSSTYPGSAFSFVAYVQPLNGKPYVDVWGGKRGHEQLKAVAPDSVRRSGGRGPSRQYDESMDFKPSNRRHKS